MKKILTLVTLFTVLLLNDATAQTTAGNIMAGGTFMITSDKQETAGEDIKSSSFTFNPTAGYFLQDNLALGAELLISTGKNGDTKTSAFAFGPFARYYMYTSNDKFAFYAQGGLRFGSEKEELDGADEVKGSTFQFYVSPGFSYFFNEKWALELQLRGIRYASEDPNKDSDFDDDKSSSFDFGTSSLNPSLGFRYFIGE